MRSVAERLAAGKPEPWIPEKAGDQLIGEVEAVEGQTGDFGPYNVTTILKSDGKAVSFAWFGNVLKNAFDRKRPVAGMTIGIQYLGTKASKVKGHQDYKDYQVELDEATRPAGAYVAPAAAVAASDFGADDANDMGDEPF